MTITFSKGDLFSSNVEAIVNPVNTVGVMGKGLALIFKKKFPENFQLYQQACEARTLKTGSVLLTKVSSDNALKWIINFPTKQHLRSKSKLQWIDSGLDALKVCLIEQNIQTVAIPALGSGLGGLDWVQVKELLYEKLKDLTEVDILIFEPR